MYLFQSKRETFYNTPTSSKQGKPSFQKETLFPLPFVAKDASLGMVAFRMLSFIIFSDDFLSFYLWFVFLTCIYKVGNL